MCIEICKVCTGRLRAREMYMYYNYITMYLNA